MFTREQRAEAYKNYRIERIDGKIYAVITVDFGRRPAEVHVQDMYQRLGSDAEAPKKLWHGTTIAADRRFEQLQRRLEELRSLRARECGGRFGAEPGADGDRS